MLPKAKARLKSAGLATVAMVRIRRSADGVNEQNQNQEQTGKLDIAFQNELPPSIERPTSVRDAFSWMQT